jgi:hypothetical protein
MHPDGTNVGIEPRTGGDELLLPMAKAKAARLANYRGA